MRCGDQPTIGPALGRQDVMDRLTLSFLIGCETTRDGPWASKTELVAIAAWLRQTWHRLKLLESIAQGQKILELNGAHPYGREPTPEEEEVLAGYGIRPSQDPSQVDPDTLYITLTAR